MEKQKRRDREKVSAVANFFLKKGQEENITITPMKLLKLVYLGYAWHYWNTKNKLFDEEILAWRHGPVIASLYHEFKHYGQHPIKTLSKELIFEEEGEDDYSAKEIIPEDIDDDIAKSALNFVWNRYKGYSSWQLRNMTHQENSPWRQAYTDHYAHDVIKDQHIEEYYNIIAKEIGLIE